MKMFRLGKSHKIAIIIIIIAVFLILENTLMRPVPAFRYNGVQIYDAIRDYRGLDYRGFDINVSVQGRSDSAPVFLQGTIIETSSGWFVLGTDSIFRIVEGPMGSKDVLADLIYFDVSPKISVEAIFMPEKSQKYVFRPGFRKFMGSIAFDEAVVTPAIIQEIRNLDGELYSTSPNRVEIEFVGSGFILDVKTPVSITLLERLLEKIDAAGVQTGYLYYYTGVENEESVRNIRHKLEGEGAILVNYFKQR